MKLGNITVRDALAVSITALLLGLLFWRRA